VIAGALTDGVRREFRRLLAARARDITEQTTRRSCMVVAPHPDDETLGCGATVARKTRAGTDVLVVVVSDGSRSHTSEVIGPVELAAIRRQEAIEAARRLGARVEFLDLPDGELSGHEPAIGRLLLDLLRRERPQQVLSPHIAEPPADHHIVARAVRSAVRALGAPTELLEYPVWMWSQWPWRGSPSLVERFVQPWPAVLVPKVAAVSTRGYLDAKRSALDAYATQTTRFRGDPAWQPLPDAFRERFFTSQELFYPVTLPPTAGRSAMGDRSR
jgi:LmbE family N-acetylglucosaminyl deacetylase